MKFFVHIYWLKAGKLIKVRVKGSRSPLTLSASPCSIGAITSATRLRVPLPSPLRFSTRLALPSRANYVKSLLSLWHIVEMEPLPSRIFSKVLALLRSTNCQRYLSASRIVQRDMYLLYKIYQFLVGLSTIVSTGQM